MQDAANATQRPPTDVIAPTADARPTELPTATTNPRFAGRFFSRDRLADMLAAPPRPTAWRVQGFVADGTLTVLAAESGKGKSWLAQTMCAAVGDGSTMAGLSCTSGSALYIDGEMGWVMFTNHRLRPTGVKVPSFEYVDASGLDVSNPADQAWLTAITIELGASLVVFDSLRKLAPSRAENDSDDMAPVLTALAKLARDTGAGVVLIHHKGDGGKPFRGSTAIRDQADALFLLAETQDSDVLRLTCRDAGCKPPRYAAAPPDVFVAIDPAAGGVRAVGPPVPRTPKPVAEAREAMKTAILNALPAESKAAVARKCGTSADHGTFKGAWAELENAMLLCFQASPCREWQATAPPSGSGACQVSVEGAA